MSWDAVTCANRLKLIVQLRRFVVIDEHRRPNLASQCLGLALRELPAEWQRVHDFRPLLAESFHDPAVHQGTLYKVTNWTPLGLTKGFRRHRADFYQDLESPKQLWVRPLHKNARSLLSQPGQLPDEHRKGIAEATCGARCALPNNIPERDLDALHAYWDVIFRPLLDNVDRIFLANLFSTAAWFRDVSDRSGGTTHKRISRGALGRISIQVPPLPEQCAIATALSDVDALLAALDRLIAKQRDLKQAAMQQLLTGQTRLPGFTGKWETKRLGEIAKIQRGASPRPIDSPIWFDENSPIGWVRISDVTRSGMFLQETTQRLSPLGVAHSRPVPTGSLIMSICATVGRPVITQIDVCIHDGFVVFDNPQADQLFLYYVLKWIEPDWSKHGQTGSQMNLNTGLITGTPILLPPLPEQTAIATVLSDMDLELAALEQRRDKTRALKQGMMQELLTGRTRLS